MVEISLLPVARKTHKFAWNINGKLCLNLNCVIPTEVIISVQTVL